jgi:hypothetical protein
MNTRKHNRATWLPYLLILTVKYAYIKWNLRSGLESELDVVRVALKATYALTNAYRMAFSISFKLTRWYWSSWPHYLVNNFWCKSGTRQQNGSSNFSPSLTKLMLIFFVPILSGSRQTHHNSELSLDVTEGMACRFKFLSHKHKTETVKHFD